MMCRKSLIFCIAFVLICESANATDDWPMFRHDVNHTGYSTSQFDSPILGLNWSYDIGDVIWSSPAVAEGVVYVGSWDNRTYALNATTGAHIWNSTLEYEIWSSPAVLGNTVYIGSDNGKVYALNASTGAQLWNFTTGDAIDSSSPAVSGGLVYIGSFDNNTYALNASTGAQLWNFTTGDRVISSPAVVGGVVYVGSDDDKVYALNATTGAHIWNYTTADDLDYGSPAIVSGVVYVGSWDDNVYALNASTGAKIWNYTTADNVRSSPAVFEGVVYVGADDNNVYALNASTGAQIWNYTTGDKIWSSPAVAGGVVFIGSYDNKTYALNASTGTLIWDYTTGNSVRSSPAVANGWVYVGSLDGKVYAFSSDTFAPVISLVSPQDMTTINPTDRSNLVEFNATVNDGSKVVNCSLYTNISGEWNVSETVTNESWGLGSSLYFNENITGNDGLYIWNIICYDKVGYFSWLWYNYTFAYDSAAPSINSISQDSIKQGQTINISANVTDEIGNPLQSSDMIGQVTNISGNNTAAQSFRNHFDFTLTMIGLNITKSNETVGDLTVEIQGDGSGEPNGTAVSGGSVTVASSSMSSAGVQNITFSGRPRLSAGTTYWIVLRCGQCYEQPEVRQYGWHGTGNGTYDGNRSYLALSADNGTTWTAYPNSDWTFDVYRQPVDNVTFEINSVNYTNITQSGNTYYFSGWDTNVTLGTYNFTLYASDANNNSNLSRGSFNITQDYAPVISAAVTNPGPLSMNDSINISINVSDDLGVDTVMSNITIPGAGVHTMVLTDPDNDSSYTGSFTNTSQNGSYSVLVWANDSYGNTDLALISFYVSFAGQADNPPRITNPYVSPDPAYINQSIRIYATVTDDTAVTSVQVRVWIPQDGTSAFILLDPDQDSVYTGSFTNTNATGTYNVSYTAVDSIGQIDTAMVTVPTRTASIVNEQILLSLGWNLMSIPMIGIV